MPAPRRQSARTFSRRRGFDFSAAMRTLCQDIVVRSPELRHIDLERVAIGFSQARKRVAHGLQASLTPMRFENGATHGLRRGRRYTVQRYHNESGQEYLYLLSFYLPRFLDHVFEEKLETVFHELWHISPGFDGDLRRFAGRYYAHGPSQCDFDSTARRLAQQWLAASPPETLYAFLHSSFAQLVDEFGAVSGVRIRAPKLIPQEHASS